MNSMYFPLDPDCPTNPMEAFYADPITEAYGTNDVDVWLEKKHRANCKRCQEYGAENLEVAW